MNLNFEDHLKNISEKCFKFLKVSENFLSKNQIEIENFYNLEYDGFVSSRNLIPKPFKFNINFSTKVINFKNKFIAFSLYINKSCRKDYVNIDKSIQKLKTPAISYKIEKEGFIHFDIETKENQNNHEVEISENKFKNIYDIENVNFIFKNRYKIPYINSINFPSNKIPIFIFKYYREFIPFFIFFILEKNNQNIIELRKNKLFDFNVFKIISDFCGIF